MHANWNHEMMLLKLLTRLMQTNLTAGTYVSFMNNKIDIIPSPIKKKCNTYVLIKHIN